MEKSRLTFLFCDAEYNESKTVIFGAPFDGTTSFRPGTRFAPNAMRNDSYGLEVYSPYQDREITEFKIFDAGDLVPAIGNVGAMIDIISDFTRTIVNDEKIPLMIGGEHSLSVGTIKVLAEKYPDLHILHFDAHTDLRDVYYNHKLSHANVLYRSWEILGDNRIFQFGIRSGDKTEFEWAKKHVIQNRYNTNGLDEALEKVKGKPVYITIDYDVLDPSVFPGTGTPEPGGISFLELLNAILKFKGLNVVGADVMELSPHYDQSGAS
ncbi:MAG: agmatinase, partial [Haloplasmataceae bacterium]|nr:agmatinase [Haloplasmataceae bacterium]